MNPPEIIKYLTEGLELMGLQLSNPKESLEHLVLYFHELKKWNKKVNLVARTLDDHQIFESHFLDSLSLLTLLTPEKQQSETLLDIGTGAGFPGLVLKVACPFLPVMLIEPRSNRFYFLKHVVRTLGLQDVGLLNVRLEENLERKELSNKKFSFITSRAFTDISRFFRLTAPYLNPDGRIVCMKGPGSEKELIDLKQENLFRKSYGLETRKLKLPFSGAERTLTIIKGSEDKFQ
jgi:16S rRNA (guanine527-N7)-methyltransferase